VSSTAQIQELLHHSSQLQILDDAATSRNCGTPLPVESANRRCGQPCRLDDCARISASLSEILPVSEWQGTT
jgi:hypothetical protein